MKLDESSDGEPSNLEQEPGSCGVEAGGICQEKCRLRAELTERMAGFNSAVRAWLAGGQASQQAFMTQRDEFHKALDQYRRHMELHGCRHGNPTVNAPALVNAPVPQQTTHAGAISSGGASTRGWNWLPVSRRGFNRHAMLGRHASLAN